MRQNVTSPFEIAQQIKKDAIVSLAAVGTPIREIASAVESSASTVCRALSDDDSQEILKNVCRKYLSHAEQVSSSFLDLLKSDDESIRLKCIQEYHKITGLTPSHAPSLIIQQVFQDNRQQKVELQGYRDYIRWRMEQDAGAIEVQPDKTNGSDDTQEPTPEE